MSAPSPTGSDQSRSGVPIRPRIIVFAVVAALPLAYVLSLVAPDNLTGWPIFGPLQRL